MEREKERVIAGKLFFSASESSACQGWQRSVIYLTASTQASFTAEREKGRIYWRLNNGRNDAVVVTMSGTGKKSGQNQD